MERWKNKIAVVTGASAGIGAAIAEELVQHEVKVVGIARREHKLEELRKKLNEKGGTFIPYKADLTKIEEIVKAFNWIKTNLGAIHILINNAGITRITDIIDGDYKYWKEVFDTNVLGLCAATQEAISNMRENNVDGHIIQISSAAAHFVPNLPKLNVYPASKHASTAATKTIRNELLNLNSKIKVTNISPGNVYTDIIETAFLDSNKEFNKKRGNDYYEKNPSLTSKDIADTVVYVLGTPPHVHIHELIIKPIGERG